MGRGSVSSFGKCISDCIILQVSYTFEKDQRRVHTIFEPRVPASLHSLSRCAVGDMADICVIPVSPLESAVAILDKPPSERSEAILEILFILDTGDLVSEHVEKVVRPYI
jgi:hypothetical protein